MSEELDVVSEAELADPQAHMRNQVWELKAKGYTRTRIAQVLKIHRHTVSKYLKEAAQEILQEHMGTTAIEILTEELAKLAENESEISRDLALITRTKGKLYFINKDEEYEEFPAALVDAQKSKLYKLKNEIINQRMKMLQDVGAMPRTPEAMKKALDDYQVNENDVIDVEGVSRSDEEVEHSIHELLRHGLRMQDTE